MASNHLDQHNWTCNEINVPLHPLCKEDTYLVVRNVAQPLVGHSCKTKHKIIIKPPKKCFQCVLQSENEFSNMLDHKCGYDTCLKIACPKN